jgi:hypothetical protein
MEAPADDAVVTLPVFIAFDLLVTRGRDVRAWPRSPGR